MAQPNNVYDPDADQEAIPHQAPDPELGQNTSSGDSSDPRSAYDPQKSPKGDSSDPRDDLSAAEKKGGLFNAGGDGAATGLGAAEAMSGAGTLGKGFSPATAGVARGMKMFFKDNKRTATTGGGVVAIIVGLIIMFSMLAIPLKIEHMVENLQKRFFATSENAVKKEERKMFVSYVRKKVLPSYKRCGSTISRKCSVKITGSTTNPVTNMYRSWSENKLETKLAENYGVEFKYRKGEWYLKSPGSGEVNVGKDGSNLDAEFKKANRREMRTALDGALEGETWWKRIMYRYKVGRLLEQKYGIKRCITFCGTKDQFADYKQSKKTAAKILLTQRVIQPRGQVFGIVMECLIDPACEPDKTRPIEGDAATTGELNGANESEMETNSRHTLSQLSASYGITDKDTVDKMIKEYETIAERGYSKYAIQEMLDRIGLKEVSKQAADAAPVVGWINRAAGIIVTLHKAGPFVRKARYITNAPAMVSTYMMYRSYADEIHTGHVDPTELGSFVSSLSPGNHGNKNDPIIGGTAGAESSPLYASIMGSGASDTQTSLLNDILPSKAFAQSSTPSTDAPLCNDNKPQTDIVCPEVKLGGGSGVLDDVNKTLDTPPLSFLTAFSVAWKSVIGKVLAPFADLFGSVLHALRLDSITNLISKAIEPFMAFLGEKLIPNPFGTNMSGSRTFDLAAGGAAVAGKDSCDQIGCGNVSTQTVASIVDEQRGDEQQQFKQSSVFARVFDTNSSYSLVTKLAMATPLSARTSAESSFANALSNPFALLADMFGGLFKGGLASAATSTDTVDPYKIGTTGYQDSEIPDDPEATWDARDCGNTGPDGPVARWQAAAHAAAPNLDTGMPQHLKPEPCLLIQAAAGNGGAKYDKNLLTEADRSGPASTSSTSSTTSSAGANIDASTLFNDSSGVACAANTKDLGVQDGYTQGNVVKIRICAVSNFPSSGEESNGNYGVSGADGKAVVNSRVSGAVYAMIAAAKSAGVDLVANSAFRTMAHRQALCPCNGRDVAIPGTANHQMGLAIDFGTLPATPGPIPGNPVWEWLAKNASRFGYKNYPHEAWHWSPTGN